MSEISSGEHADLSMDCMSAAGEALDDGRTDAAYINAIGGIQQALLAIHCELRRANDAPDVPPGPCMAQRAGILFRDGGPPPVFVCRLRAGHAGGHEAADGTSWT